MIIGSTRPIASFATRPNFASLGIDGRGDVVSTTLTRSIYTDATYNIALLGGHQWSSTRSTVGIVDTDTITQRLFGGLKGQVSLPETGTYLEGEARVIHSFVNVWGLAGPESREVTRYVGDLTVFQEFDNGVSLQSRLSGQYSPEKRLPSGELWYLGGAASLPAYELSAVSGDTGFLIANQIRYTDASLNDEISQAFKVPVTVGARAFLNFGTAFDDFNIANVGTTYADIGFGFDFDIGGRVNGDLAVAWPIDADPGAAVKNPRFLFRLSVNAF